MRSRAIPHKTLDNDVISRSLVHRVWLQLYLHPSTETGKYMKKYSEIKMFRNIFHKPGKIFCSTCDYNRTQYKILSPRLTISFIWSAFPAIIVLWKDQSVNIFTIHHVHRRRFRTVTLDIGVLKTVPRRSAKRVRWRKYIPPWRELNETFI